MEDISASLISVADHRDISHRCFDGAEIIGWINRAKRIETKQKRLDQMLYELERGDLYMKMDYTPKNQKAVEAA